MHSFKEFLKKSPLIRSCGRYVRRVIFNSKYPYFLSSSPLPLSNQYGFDRGTPLDRFFIEDFLEKNALDIKGRCLEVHSNDYTLKYGGSKITTSDVLDIEEANKNATIVDDLRKLQKIADNTYDTIILTQVFQFIDDVESAIAESYRILKPQGVLLVTLPCLSRADCTSGVAHDYWRFTEAAAKYLFEKKFLPQNLVVDFYGNARSGVYFYAGLAVEDCPKKVLLSKDPNFPTIITVRATK